MTQSNKSNLKDPDSQKVEVVVQSPEGEVNIFGELSILVLRVSFSLLIGIACWIVGWFTWLF